MKVIIWCEDDNFCIKEILMFLNKVFFLVTVKKFSMNVYLVSYRMGLP